MSRINPLRGDNYDGDSGGGFSFDPVDMLKRILIPGILILAVIAIIWFVIGGEGDIGGSISQSLVNGFMGIK